MVLCCYPQGNVCVGVQVTWATHHVLTANRPSADYYCAVHVQAGVLTLSGRMLAVH